MTIPPLEARVAPGAAAWSDMNGSPPQMLVETPRSLLTRKLGILITAGGPDPNVDSPEHMTKGLFDVVQFADRGVSIDAAWKVAVETYSRPTWQPETVQYAIAEMAEQLDGQVWEELERAHRVSLPVPRAVERVSQLLQECGVAAESSISAGSPRVVGRAPGFDGR